MPSISWRPRKVSSIVEFLSKSLRTGMLMTYIQVEGQKRMDITAEISMQEGMGKFLLFLPLVLFNGLDDVH